MPINTTCVVLSTVYDIKPWLPRKRVIRKINSGCIIAYLVENNVVISVESFNELDKIFLVDKLQKQRVYVKDREYRD
jgi:hypothetical protein